MTEDEAIRQLCLARLDHELCFKAWLDDPSDENKAGWQASVRELRSARRHAHWRDEATVTAVESHQHRLATSRAAQAGYRERRRLRVAGDLVDDVVGRDEGEDPGEA